MPRSPAWPRRSRRSRRLLVVDAMTGQEAVAVAEAFAAAVPVTGLDPDQDRRRCPRRRGALASAP